MIKLRRKRDIFLYEFLRLLLGGEFKQMGVSLSGIIFFHKGRTSTTNSPSHFPSEQIDFIERQIETLPSFGIFLEAKRNEVILLNI